MEPLAETSADSVGAPGTAQVGRIRRDGTTQELLTHRIFGWTMRAGRPGRQTRLPVGYASGPAIAVWVCSK